MASFNKFKDALPITITPENQVSKDKIQPRLLINILK